MGLTETAVEEHDTRIESNPREGLKLIDRIREIGPYEEWYAKPVNRNDLPEIVIARRPDPDRHDSDLLRRRLELASARAQHVEHHLTVQCFGILEAGDEIVQVLERIEGADLEAVLRPGEPAGKQMGVIGALWLARQVLDAICHAHALSVVHGVLTPAHVVISDKGAVKIDFALSVGKTEDSTLTEYVDLRYVRAGRAPETTHPRLDVFAVAAILFELLTGRQALTVGRPWAIRPFAPDVPGSLESEIAKCLESNERSPDARSLIAFLDQVYYAELEALDEDDGQNRVRAWLEKRMRDPETIRTSRGETPTRRPDAPTAMMQGHFTRAMRAREQPVEPQDFSRDDYFTNSASDLWSVARPGEAPTEAVPFGLGAPSETSTVPVVATETPLVTTATPVEVPMRGALEDPYSVSVPPSVSLVRPASGPASLVWTLLGFIVTLSLIFVWSWVQ